MAREIAEINVDRNAAVVKLSVASLSRAAAHAAVEAADDELWEVLVSRALRKRMREPFSVRVEDERGDIVWEDGSKRPLFEAQLDAAIMRHGAQFLIQITDPAGKKLVGRVQLAA